MARSFNNAKLVSAFVADQISAIAMIRRGYAAAASQGLVSSSVRGGRGGVVNVILKKGKGGGEESSKRTTSWVPDPVTGYYRPEGHANEIDPADLRKKLLSHNSSINKNE